nr:MAG TPA: DNA directed RNA polymerase [Caudoviricetes sp.]
MSSKIIARVTARLEEMKAETLRILQKQGRPRVPAQSLFIAACRAAGLEARRNLVSDFTAVKPLVRALVASGDVEFHHVEGGTSFYTVPSIDPATGNSARPAGQGVAEPDDLRLPEDSLHSRALSLLAKKAWRVNRERLTIAQEQNAQGKLFHDGQWVECDGQDDSFKQQTLQIAAVSALFERQDAVSFDTFTDDRGRLYIRGGYTSPHMGKLARWLYTADDEITLDHRTSFAQNYSLLTGSQWGKHCGIGTSEDCDFWAGMLKPYGIEIAPHSQARQACKAYGMPRFYGAGQKLAAERAGAALQAAVSTGELSQDEATAILDALEKLGESLTSFQTKTRAFAQSFVEWGEHPQWKTPSGFTALKRYYHHRSIVWNSGENEVSCMPKSMTVLVQTRQICETVKDEHDKSVLVATTANILQSLDASVMAMTIVKFHERTGLVLFPIHDSYTVPSEHADALRECVIESMRQVADSDEVKALRRELGLMPVKVLTGKARPNPQMVNLDLRAMNPLDEE